MRSGARLGSLAVGLTLPLFVPIADAQKAGDPAPVKCVSAARIRQMEPIDDQTILFYMRGDAVYRNTLREVCHELQWSREVSYGINAGRLSQVCDGHPISVKETGALCALGPFHPISTEEARALAATDKRR